MAFVIATLPAHAAAILWWRPIDADGRRGLMVQLDAPSRQAPSHFALTDPPRIAIDFPDTALASDAARQRYPGTLRAVAAVQGDRRTRLVLELARPLRYRTEWQGSRLLVLFDGDAGGVAPVVRELDFRRGDGGAGRVVVELSDGGAISDIARQGDRLLVRLPDATLAGRLRRRFDVTDFGTPVTAFEAAVTAHATEGAGVTLTIEARGQWQHSSYQTGKQLIVELRPEAAPATVATTMADRISLDFRHIDIRALLQVFAHFTGLNLLTSDSVQGDLTMRLRNVPWQQALQTVLDAKGLASQRSGNVVWVAPRAELAAKRKRELESLQQLAELEPLRTQVFPLNYQRADEVRRMLLGQDAGIAVAMPPQTPPRPAGARMLSRRGTLTADLRTNQLFVADTAASLDAIRTFLASIDVPVRQVVIEARIVEADDKFSRDLGVRLGFRGHYRNARIGSGYDSVMPGASTAAGAPFLSLPALGRNGVDAPSAAIGLFDRAATRLLALELSALEAEGRGKIVSSPRVITANHIRALIEQGTELPYQAATSSGATSVQFRRANLRLEVTPQITPEGNVLLDVDVNKDSVGAQTTQGFAIDTKHVQTQVLVDNGGTVVIGGIYTQTERRDDNKVPLLGDLPMVGALFRNTATIRDRTELLVFLTPRILRGTSPASWGDADGMQ